MIALSVMYGLMDDGRYELMPLIVVECVGEKRTDQAWGYLSWRRALDLCSLVGDV